MPKHAHGWLAIDLSTVGGLFFGSRAIVIAIAFKW